MFGKCHVLSTLKTPCNSSFWVVRRRLVTRLNFPPLSNPQFLQWLSKSPSLTGPFDTVYILIYCLLTCFRPEYAWNICHWTLNNNQSITQPIFTLSAIMMVAPVFDHITLSSWLCNFKICHLIIFIHNCLCFKSNRNIFPHIFHWFIYIFKVRKCSWYLFYPLEDFRIIIVRRILCWFVWLGFNATFNNISVISRRPVLLVEEAGVSERTTDLWQVTDKPYHVRCELNATSFCMVQTQARTHAI